VLRASARSDFDRLAGQGDLVPVFRELRHDEGTPVGAFLRLRAERTSFLLESMEGGERWGRWSYLGAAPRRVIAQRGNTLSIREGRRTRTVLEERPLEGLRALLRERRPVACAGLPPFTGGFVGYLSFAAATWFEPHVPQRHGPDPAFPDAEWMEVDRLVAFDGLRHTVVLIANADLQRHRTRAAAFGEAQATLDRLEALLARRLPAPGAYPPPRGVRAAWDAAGFKRAVARVKAYIRDGDCMQVVLSRRVEARYRGDPFELYRRVRATTPAPYLFYLRFADRVLTGASPEVLVRVKDGEVTVRPIAGTRRRGASPEEDLRIEAELRADPKERAEHVMLLDLGRNDVGRVSAPGSVRIDEREVVERYSHVMHLVSQVSGTLRQGQDALDAVAASFPAGTVSGAPKVRAMQIIDELEPVARGPYAGAVGYVGFDGAVDLAITIRSLALCGDRLRLQAGAGLVHDSSPERELEETSEKLRGLLTALGARDPIA
jgi:anthranilate synthase component 1